MGAARKEIVQVHGDRSLPLAEKVWALIVLGDGRGNDWVAQRVAGIPVEIPGGDTELAQGKNCKPRDQAVAVISAAPEN